LSAREDTLKKIFVVDDSDMYLLTADDALKKRYDVFTMPSASKMFALLLEELTPDLSLLDIDMPDMNGFEALQKLKSSEKWMDIPVVFLTGMTDDGDEAKGLALGAADFVVKPFSPEKLLNCVQTHLDID
jgi:putative two-component system response regulator